MTGVLNERGKVTLNYLISTIHITGQSFGETGATTLQQTKKQNAAMIKDQRLEDVTWLTPTVAMFKNHLISERSNSKIYHGRQELLAGNFRDVAIKLIRYSKKNESEIVILTKLSHPNIVQIYDAGKWEDKQGHWIYIVMELCSLNLEEYVMKNPANPENAWQFLKQIVTAVEFMHKQNIAHRDIKPSNILISKCGSFIKVSDFGISKEIPDNLTSVTTTTHAAGTDGYKPPETYDPNYKVTLRSDIFSFGVVSAFLLSHGKHPFGDDPLDWSYNIRKNRNFDLSRIPSVISQRERLVDLISKMLKHAPSDRPSAKAILYFFESRGSTPHRPPGTRKVISNGVVSSDHAGLGSSPQLDVEEETTNSTIVLLTKSRLHRVNLKSKSVTPMQKFPEDCSIFKAVSIDHYLYILKTHGSEVYRLKHGDTTARWGKLPDRPEYHGWYLPSVVASADAIFQIGSTSDATKVVSKYIPSQGTWERLKDKPAATRRPTLLCTKDFLFCVGGRDERGDASLTVEKMDLKTSVWFKVADLCWSNVLSAAEFKKKIYVFCGFVGVSSIQSWDPEVDQWTAFTWIQNQKLYRHFPIKSGFEVDGKLYLISDEEILEYDVEQNMLGIHQKCNSSIEEAVLVKTRTPPTLSE